MRRAAWRSKLKSAWEPPSLPTLTMRPLILVAARFWLATLPETWSTIRSTPSPLVAFSTCSTQPGSLESTARSAPKSFSRPRRVASVEEPITRLAPLSFAICSAAGAHHLVAGFEAFGLRSRFGDLAGPLHAEHGADAAGAAMRVAFGHTEVGAIEAAGADANQHLRALWRGFWDVGDCGAIGAVDIGFHEHSRLAGDLTPLTPRPDG